MIALCVSEKSFRFSVTRFLSLDLMKPLEHKVDSLGACFHEFAALPRPYKLTWCPVAWYFRIVT